MLSIISKEGAIFSSTHCKMPSRVYDNEADNWFYRNEFHADDGSESTSSDFLGDHYYSSDDEADDNNQDEGVEELQLDVLDDESGYGGWP